jgi:ribosomal protein S6--L-glutamate ligase
VADIHIPIGSKYIGMTIEGTGLRELDVVVLTLRRKGIVISNPKSSRVLEAEDTMLCYGKSEHMKGLIPQKKKKRRKMKKLPKPNDPTS